MSYFAIIPARDCGSTIDAAIGTLLRQTVPPLKVIVINDGSTDRTEEIIDSFGTEKIIKVNTGNKTRDYRRLVEHWNTAIQIAIAEGFYWQCDYHLISAGDVSYERDYAEKVLAAMQNSQVMIASGDFSGTRSSAPHGAGRFVSNAFFHDNYCDRYPAIIGYESEILQRVLLHGLKLLVVKDARMQHLEKLGHSHNFKEFGYAMRALGYNYLFVVARCMQAFLTKNEMGRKGALKMFYYYLTFRPEPHGYYSYFPEDLRREISRRQKKRMIEVILSAAKKVYVL